MEIKRGLTKENVNKLVKWEGFKKEIPWILFWIAVFILAYTYWSDKQLLNQITDEECYKLCKFNAAIEQMRLKNPTLKFNCDYETLRCEVYGVLGKEFVLPTFEFELVRNSTNETD